MPVGKGQFGLRLVDSYVVALRLLVEEKRREVVLAEGARPVDRRFEVDRTVAAVRLGVGQVVGADNLLLQDQVAELVSAAGHVLRGCLGACQMVVVLGVERAFDGDGEPFGYPVAEVLREREERLRRVVELLAVTGLRQQHVGVLAVVGAGAGQQAVGVDGRKDVGSRFDRIVPNRRRRRSRFVLALEGGGQVDVELGVFVELHLDVGAEVELAEEDRRVVLLHVVAGEQTVFVVETARNVVFGRAAAARHVDVDALVEREILVEVVHPVYVGIEVGIGAVAVFLDDFGRVDLAARGGVPQFGELHGVEHVGDFGRLHHAGFEADVDLGFADDTLARGDEDHAVGAAHAVDGRRGGVFEDREVLDVLDVDQIQITFDAVDEHQRRRAAAEGRDAADPEGRAGARFARTLHRDHAGQLAGQVVGDFGRRHPDVVDRDRGDRPHDAGLLLRAVSHDDHFVEFVAGREFDHLGKVGDGELLCLIADVGDGDVAVVSREGVVESSVDVGVRSQRRIFDPDRRADDRLLGLGIDHAARDVTRLRRLLRSLGARLLLRKDDRVVADHVADTRAAECIGEQLLDVVFRRIGLDRDVVGQITLVGDLVRGLRFDLSDQFFQVGHVPDADRVLLRRLCGVG